MNLIFNPQSNYERKTKDRGILATNLQKFDTYFYLS